MVGPVNGRDTRPATVAACLQKVDADLLVSGHIPCERGFDAPNDRQLILDSMGTPACYCLFPTGRPASPRWRPLVWISLACALLMVVGSMFGPGRLTDALRPPSGPGANFGVDNPFGIDALGGALGVADLVGRMAGFLFLLIAAIGLVIRLVRAHGDERQQLKWVAYVGSAIGVGVLGTVFLGSDGPFGPPGNPALQDFSFVVVLAGFVVGLPVATVIAVLKYRLYDIDIVINKTVLFGAMAAFITLVYVAIVVGIGNLLGQSGKPNLGLSILATAIVAVAFQPVRERVQRLANQLVYGRRATPYEVLSQFSGRIATTYGSEEILPQMANVLAEGTGASRADVWLRIGDHMASAASWPAEDRASARSVALTGELLPSMPAVTRLVPVHQQGELLGALSINKRPGEAVTPIEDDLLKNLAAQAGLVLRNVGLTAELRAKLEEISRQAVELRASRQRIVAAQDAERRRLERNIHDGAQQNLVALTVRLRLAMNQMKTNPARAVESVRGLEAETDEALRTLRDLARGIYPPILREQGLAAALKAQAGRMPGVVDVSASGFGRQPADLEATIYFCCLEALQNAAKHALASTVRVTLEQQAGNVLFSVIDDGVGFEQATVKAGAGFQNMKDRVEALGGHLDVVAAPRSGTRVTGYIPAIPLTS